ncbi:UDP-N-acetylmuramoyl-L-alanyl-D-glutamate--2,6-diaminopimelate ligase [Clostridium ihumii]|uniref:UDP-N-acetylmuramoyl-L-alanyl-D-glutamate--2, 6-diaminopimelate ligase n=1 Tax=Clostridium ihumii TaxID=1470356 RepID=UPI00058AED44|nr:UDP-N-acetylmuramoyl-L-alanyl-D-glutamate--2,6-diaminopimelate ligase [Clostridium ihumii]
MEISKLLNNIEFKILKGDENCCIKNIQYDSRKISKDDMFFCIEGFNVDGHKYIDSAINNGALAIVVQKDIDIKNENVIVIKVEDTRKALAVAASNYYDNPSEKLKIIGITGTNGKTTSTFMMKSILEKCGYKVGLIGTIANYIGAEKLKSERTTPESLELQAIFNKMVKNDVTHCIMEVSSHSLELDRVYNVNFSEGIFTNLTQDHLDFHKTFENYFNAKLKLFKKSNTSIVNIDDKYGKTVVEKLGNEVLTYSIDENSTFKAENLRLHSRGMEFTVNINGKDEKIELSVPGKYNVYNALGSIIAALEEGATVENIREGLKNIQVPGRCEIVTLNHNLGYDVIVDYAHTPDGLENVLKSVRELAKGRLISVFGCGGDRDKTKRPIMGKIGSELSDIAILTSDNPRSEEPLQIIDDVKAGIKKDNYIIIENRRDAIKHAMKIANENDIIVVAGKGHEDYQVLKDKTIHFDEREVIEEIIKELE